MKKAFKRTVAFCLAVVMIISLTTVFAFAAEGSCGEDLSWEIKDGTLTISGSGAMEDYTTANEAPWYEQRFSITKIKIGDKVTTIGNYAFSGLENLVTADCGNVELIGNFAFFCCVAIDSVTLGDSVKYIGEGAFANCSVLSQVEFPDTVETIDAGAFMGTCIEGDLVFGDKLKSIGTMAFYMCLGITGVTVPDSTVTIGDAAFFGCEFIDSVSLGKGLIHIGDLAFAYCSDLKDITVAGGNTAFKGVDDALLTKDGKKLIAYAIDKGMNVTVPSTVKEIGEAAFAGSFTIASVTLPEGLEIIGSGAFANCWGLETIKLPASLTTIGELAFASDFSVTEVTIPKNVSVIGDGAFCDMSMLTNFVVESGNANFTVRNGVIFNSDETVLIACPGGKEGTYTIPSTVKTIVPYAFSGCAMLSVNIPNGVKTIGDSAFRYTYTMKSLTIPESVTYIGENVFGESGLTAVNVASGNAAYTSVNGVLFTKDMKTLICYPIEKSRESYVVPEGVTAIADHAFEYSNITGVTIPDSVQVIGNYAFNLCDNFNKLTIGNGVRVIGEYAFADCSITEVKLPFSLESVGEYAFAWCEELDSVVFNGTPYIDICAFAWCEELDDVEFKATAPTDLGEMAFYGCSDVFTITYVKGMAGWTSPTWMGYKTKDDGEAVIIAGDVNGDGDITNNDLVLIARHIVGLDEVDLAVGDTDGDGVVSNTDLITVARIIVGLE